MQESDMKSVSISEFFSKNKQMLGFGSASKAIVTAIKEAVDNSLDACEENGILPSIEVSITKVNDRESHITVVDNGPGIDPEHIPNVFAKLLFGSKFHRRRQSRGQQGIGISAVGMYSLGTTGRPMSIVSKLPGNNYATSIDVRINTKNNEPEVLSDKKIHYEKDQGTKVSFFLDTVSRPAGLLEYIEYTIIANPHMSMYLEVDGEIEKNIERATFLLPKEAIETKPHLHGMDFGKLMELFRDSDKTVLDLLVEEFYGVNVKSAEKLLSIASVSNCVASEIGPENVKRIVSAIEWSNVTIPDEKKFISIANNHDSTWPVMLCETIGVPLKFCQTVLKDRSISPNARPAASTDGFLKSVHSSLNSMSVKFSPPSVNSISTVGEESIISGMKSIFKADYYNACTRKPLVHNGNPFAVEVGIAYGGDIKQFQLIRLANRVPLLYSQYSCGIKQAVNKVVWKPYSPGGEIEQKKGEFPVAPIVLVVQVVSVWIPFTSEAKEAISPDEVIMKEITLAIMACARGLGSYLSSCFKLDYEQERRRKFSGYIDIVAESIEGITGVDKNETVNDFTVLMNELSKERTGAEWS